MLCLRANQLLGGKHGGFRSLACGALGTRRTKPRGHTAAAGALQVRALDVNTAKELGRTIGKNEDSLRLARKPFKNR